MKIGPKDTGASNSPQPEPGNDSNIPELPSDPTQIELIQNVDQILKASQQSEPQNAETGFKASQQNASVRRSETGLQGALIQQQMQQTANKITALVTQKPIPVDISFSNFGQQVQTLMQKLRGAAPQNPVVDVAQKLEASLARINNLSVPPDMNARNAMNMTGMTDQIETLLYTALSAAFSQASGVPSQDPQQQNFVSILAQLLSQLQGRAGDPMGFPQGTFRPTGKFPDVKKTKTGTEVKDAGPQDTAVKTKTRTGPGDEAGRKKRAEEAEQIAQSGALGAGDSKKDEHPEIPKSEQDSIHHRFAVADDDAAVKLSNDKKALSVATPEEKAKCIRELMSGHTTDSEDRAMVRIAMSCTSKAEYDKVMELSGGADAVYKEMDANDAKAGFKKFNSELKDAQNQATDKAVGLLEKVESPEEAKELAAKMGGPSLKHQVHDPATLERLNAVGKRFELPALGYGLPPEEVQQKRAAIDKAFKEEDSDSVCRLAEDRDALKVASPAEKSRMIRELQRGWTKDSQDMAVYKIMASCTSKEEFDQVAQLAGGRGVIKDLDNPEAKQKMDQLCGAWDRTDLAENKKQANDFKGVMADPRKQSELSATRPPTEEELKQLGGNYNIDPRDSNNPEMQQANQAMGMTREHIQKKTLDIDWDPQAKTELVLEQRRRELNGSPKLDWTGLAVEADKIISDPDFEKKVKQYQAENDVSDSEAAQRYVTDKMQGLAVKNGISEQTLKSLVTQRMGQIYNDGAQEMNGYRNAIVAPLTRQLAEAEMRYGPDSPEAMAIRNRLSKFDNATGQYTNRLAQTGAVSQTLFPMPKSIAEDMVAAAPVVLDIAAAVCIVVPGVGPAITGTYFGAKGAIAAAQGDALGALTSFASAIPGFGGVLGGAAGAALQAGGRMAQAGIGVARGISHGNVLGTMGSLAGMGAGVAPILDYAQKGFRLADGISRGDVSALAGMSGEMLGPLANEPGVQSILQNPIVKQAGQYVQRGLPVLQAIATGDATGAFSALAGQLMPLAQNNPEAQRVLGWVNDGTKFVDSLGNGDYGKALLGLDSGLQQLALAPQAPAVGQSIGQLMNMIETVGNGDAQQLVSVLQGANGVPGFVDQFANAGLSKPLADISNLTTQFVNSPSYQMPMDLMQSGMRFLGAVGSGDLVSSLDRIPGIPEAYVGPVVAMARQFQPLIRFMAQGNFEKALDQLRSNPLTQPLAQNLSKLEAISDIVQPPLQRAISTHAAILERVVEINQSLDQVRVFEKVAKQLQQTFALDFTAMAQYLLRIFGTAKTPYRDPTRPHPREFPTIQRNEIPTSTRIVPPGVFASSPPNPTVIASVADSISTGISAKTTAGSQKTAASRRGEAALEGRLRQADIQIEAPNKIPERPVDSTSNTEPSELNRNSKKPGGSDSGQ